MAYSAPLILTLEAFAIIGLFWTLTEQYPNWQKTGSSLLIGLAMIGVFAAVVTRSLNPPDGWKGIWDFAIPMQRQVSIGLAIVLTGVRFLLRWVAAIPIRQSAKRATDLITIEVGLSLLGASLSISLGRRIPAVAFYFPVVAGLVNGLLWALYLPAASDALPEFQPTPKREYLQRLKDANQGLFALRDLAKNPRSR